MSGRSGSQCCVPGGNAATRTTPPGGHSGGYLPAAGRMHRRCSLCVKNNRVMPLCAEPSPPPAPHAYHAARSNQYPRGTGTEPKQSQTSGSHSWNSTLSSATVTWGCTAAVDGQPHRRRTARDSSARCPPVDLQAHAERSTPAPLGPARPTVVGGAAAKHDRDGDTTRRRSSSGEDDAKRKGPHPATVAVQADDGVQLPQASTTTPSAPQTVSWFEPRIHARSGRVQLPGRQPLP